MTTVVGRAQVLADVEREVRRIVDRLSTLRLDRAEASAEDCLRAGEVLLAHTVPGDLGRPADATVPRLGPTGLAAMIAVLGQDYLAAAAADTDAGPSQVLDALVALRRALP